MKAKEFLELAMKLNREDPELEILVRDPDCKVYDIGMIHVAYESDETPIGIIDIDKK